MNLMKKRQKNINLKVHKITMKKLKRQVKGITLIALVVTVIVLLILAGVAISLTVGDNGLFRRAQNATDTWQEASEREAIELAVAGMQIGSMQETGMTKQELENSLKEQFGDEASVEENEDGSFLVTIGENKYYVGEDGEIIDSSNMVKISTADELKLFWDDVNSGNTYEDWYIYLANDITLDINEEWEPIGVYPMENTSPEDESNRPFKGIFDGCNHEINGIYINTTDKVQGLFGVVVSGTIKNVTIGSENSFNVGGGAAGLVGYLYNGNIYNSVNESNINATGSYVGGIAGFSIENSNIENCSNTGNITSVGEFFSVGGIVGQQGTNSTILKSSNSGVISSYRTAGGIVGFSHDSLIEECFNTNNISVNYYGAAGISGNSEDSVINDCYNVGDINTDNRNAAGIMGDVRNTNKINNCYNTGNISGNSRISSIANQNGQTVIDNCYYLENTVNGANETDVISSVTVKTSEELKALAPTLGAAFEEAPEGTNDGYPILQWQ